MRRTVTVCKAAETSFPSTVTIDSRYGGENRVRLHVQEYAGLTGFLANVYVTPKQWKKINEAVLKGFEEGKK